MSEVSLIRDDYTEREQEHSSIPANPPGSSKITLLAAYKFAVVASLVPIALAPRRKRNVYSPVVGTAPTPAPAAPAAAAAIAEAPPASAETPPPLPATPEASPTATTTAGASAADSPEVSLASSAAAPDSPDPPPEARPAAAPTPLLERSPRCSDTHAGYICEIFTTIANTWAPKLIFKKERLDALGGELRRHRVHPFEILRHMPRESIRRILLDKSPPVVNDVIKGIQEGMERERPTLERYAAGLAEDMDKDAEKLIPLIQAGNWRGVVEYLFDIAPVRKK